MERLAVPVITVPRLSALMQPTVPSATRNSLSQNNKKGDRSGRLFFILVRPSLEIGKPRFVFLVFTLYNIEKDGLQFFSYFTRFPISDGSAVKFPYRGNLCRCSCKECLVGDIDLITGEPHFDCFYAQIFCNSKNAVTGNPFENRGQRRCLERGVP